MLFATLPVPPNARNASPVIYHSRDYVGLLRHLMIFVVDGFVLWLGAIAITVLYLILQQLNLDVIGLLAIPAGMIFAWWYLTVLKRSRIRTLGYWIAGARIVTLYGEPPTIGRMTLRLMLIGSWMVGLPVDALMDFIWTMTGDDRQMLRDALCGTRLIRSKAQPIGHGKVTYCLFTGLGRTFFYPRVQPLNNVVVPSETVT